MYEMVAFIERMKAMVKKGRRPVTLLKEGLPILPGERGGGGDFVLIITNLHYIPLVRVGVGLLFIVLAQAAATSNKIRHQQCSNAKKDLGLTLSERSRFFCPPVDIAVFCE
jgi:hypothetical protein